MKAWINPIFRQKYFIIVTAVTVLIAVNVFLRLALPGTDADIRPQIVIIFLIGYIFGPVFGFLTGFLGNVITDLFLGYGFKYLLSWSIGNGLIGLVMGLFPIRKQLKLENQRQLFYLVIYIIGANIIAFGYSALMANVVDRNLIWDINIRHFLLPILNSNILVSLLFIPGILFLLKRIKQSYSIKISMVLFYFVALILIIGWLVVFPGSGNIPTAAVSETGGISVNIAIDAFNRWALMGIVFLLATFFAAGWLSRTLLRPVANLETAVDDLLRGDDESAGDTLNTMAGKDDELALLSFTLGLLSKHLWNDQRLFKEQFLKKMKFIGRKDHISDVFFIGLATLFGKELISLDCAIPESHASGSMSGIDAVELAVTMGGFSELAETYSEANIQKSLGDEIVQNSAFPQKQLQCLALAVDLNLLFPGKLRIIDFKQPLDEALAWHLFFNIDTFLNSEKNYLGYVTEDDIAARLSSALEKVNKIHSPEIETIIDQAVIERLITGYNIKRVVELANFDRNLKLTYGHSNVKHLMQLTGLLKREKVQAKLQLELKRSAFLYLDSWIKNENLNFKRLGEGVSLVRCDEFDLVMEFTYAEKRVEFQKIIETWSSLEKETVGQVLYKSWVSPLLYAEVPAPHYYRINSLFLVKGDYQIQTYIPERDVDIIHSWFRKHFPEAEISVQPLWVNAAFYRYIYNPEVKK